MHQAPHHVAAFLRHTAAGAIRLTGTHENYEEIPLGTKTEPAGLAAYPLADWYLLASTHQRLLSSTLFSQVPQSNWAAAYTCRTAGVVYVWVTALPRCR